MRVVVVDDQELMRRGLMLLLGTAAGVEVVGEAADGREGLAVVERTAPDVVLADARMPTRGGVELVADLAERRPGLPVIILTTFDDEPLVRAAVEAGAAGFLLKDTSVEDLVHAMESVRDGGLVLDPRVARAVTRGGPSAQGDGPGLLAVLTPTERVVAARVAAGATNGEIAAALVLAEGTVKNHVSSLLRKLGSRDRVSLALLLARYLGTGQDTPRPR